MPEATAFLIESPSAATSGIETAMPSGRLATVASISWLIWTMSKVSGARYSTVTPMSFAAASAPFLITDQNGSAAWPWVTTMIRMGSWAMAAEARPTAKRTEAAVVASAFMGRPPWVM